MTIQEIIQSTEVRPSLVEIDGSLEEFITLAKSQKFIQTKDPSVLAEMWGANISYMFISEDERSSIEIGMYNTEYTTDDPTFVVVIECQIFPYSVTLNFNIDDFQSIVNLLKECNIEINREIFFTYEN
jgi:hypothetical protein